MSKSYLPVIATKEIYEIKGADIIVYNDEANVELKVDGLSLEIQEMHDADGCRQDGIAIGAHCTDPTGKVFVTFEQLSAFFEAVNESLEGLGKSIKFEVK